MHAPKYGVIGYTVLDESLKQWTHLQHFGWIFETLETLKIFWINFKSIRLVCLIELHFDLIAVPPQMSLFTLMLVILAFALFDSSNCIGRKIITFRHHSPILLRDLGYTSRVEYCGLLLTYSCSSRCSGRSSIPWGSKWRLFTFSKAATECFAPFRKELTESFQALVHTGIKDWCYCHMKYGQSTRCDHHCDQRCLVTYD